MSPCLRIRQNSSEVVFGPRILSVMSWTFQERIDNLFFMRVLFIMQVVPWVISSLTLISARIRVSE